MLWIMWHTQKLKKAVQQLHCHTLKISDKRNKKVWLLLFKIKKLILWIEAERQGRSVEGIFCDYVNSGGSCCKSYFAIKTVNKRKIQCFI